jgi:Protein of unknown function (DUF1553)/Protein of unknown function (DUF1549)/Planctomycete cytochrome C
MFCTSYISQVFYHSFSSVIISNHIPFHSMFSRHFVLFVLSWLLVLPLGAETKIKYGRDIRPILSDRCFFCHGSDPKTREEDLRLDIREEAIEARAFIPGNPEKSKLIKLINATDEDDIMPPPSSHKTLSQKEKKLLYDWIKAGAEYEPHWAYSAPQRDTKESIDSLVTKDLKNRNLELSPPADPTTLLRRLHFDTIGLPPTPEQTSAFLKAYTADPNAAIRKVVDELLGSPHFGERMALSWLDGVRYADTLGYHGDQERSASPFRDYVIDAFNKDMPFDQFTIEQLAGDLLPNATLSQKVAASYNRINQISGEGGIQDAEYLAKYQAERVRTTTSAWLGSTLACAECHDHKFDPFTAKDFYSFAAFFSDILEKGAWNGDGKYQDDTSKWAAQGLGFNQFGPYHHVPTKEQSILYDQKTTLLTKLKAERDSITTTPESLTKWIAVQKVRVVQMKPVDMALLDETLPQPATYEPKVSLNDKNGPVQAGTHSRKQEANGLTQHTATLKKPVTVHQGDSLFLWVHIDPAKPARAIMLQVNTGNSWSHRAYWGEAVISYGKDEAPTAYHRAGDIPKAGEWIRLSVPIASIGIAPGAVISQLACTQFDGLVHWDNVGLHTSHHGQGLEDLSTEAIALLKSESPDRGKLATFQKQSLPEWKKLTSEITELEKSLASLKQSYTTVPATLSAAPRQIRLLNRGDWQDKTGPIVEPATPGFLTATTPASTNGARPSRLDLAKWIVSRENPLTSRVFVNRLWARLFGTGLSKDTGDLGLQGEYPSNPELLDWLALEFMENKWSVKHIMRTILLSHTYQQSSTPTQALAETDPQNRLLARQTQLRLPAELIRDNALFVSGLLNPTIGGPSARPYQPAGYYRHLNFPQREYKPHTGALLYRRGLYTHWQRTFLHPMLKAFDAPAREECTPERSTSNTPLQALNLLNDPTFTEAARVMAARLLKEPEGDRDLTKRAFLLCLNRQPTAEEARILNEFHTQELQRFTASPDDARKFLTVGEMAAPADIPAVQLAAAASLSRAILNLHESITRY